MKEINTIYIIKNTINNKVYIGQTWETINKRFDRHKYGSTKDYKNLKLPKFYSAMKKYGVENFYIEAISSSKTQEDANYLEGYFIELFDSVNNGYNLMSGGGSYGKHSEETKQKMRIAASKLPSKKGIPLSENSKKAISFGNKGKKKNRRTKKNSIYKSYWQK